MRTSLSRLAVRWLTVAVVLLAGCAMMVRSHVTRFHQLDASPKKYVLVPTTEQEGSLEHSSYASLVRTRLNALGWSETPFDEADVAVFVQYAIGAGRQVVFSYPIMGQVPTGNSNSTSTFNVTTYGSNYATGTVHRQTTNQTRLGIVGAGAGTTTVFDRALRVDMVSVAEFKATNRVVSLYEGTVRSTGSSGVLSEVLPALVEALFKDFPGTSGRTTVVDVPLTQ